VQKKGHAREENFFNLTQRALKRRTRASRSVLLRAGRAATRQEGPRKQNKQTRNDHLKKANDNFL